MGRVIRGMRRLTAPAPEMKHAGGGNAKVNAFDERPRDGGWTHGPSAGGNGGASNFYRQIFSDKSMIGSIYNRIALDVAGVQFYHAMLDKDQDIPVEIVRDTLNERLTLEANVDQSSFAFMHDAVLTMFHNGVVGIAPIETSADPTETSSFNIGSWRCGPVSTYYPRQVTLNLWDDREVDSKGQPVAGGVRKDLTFSKFTVALVQNPFYEVMNKPNGLLQRLLRKLEILDGLDEAVGSGKLDMIMQLPYAVRGDKRTNQAEARRQALRDQLKDDELGIGYIDITEKVIQLNRPIDNKLLDQIETLFKKVMDELGMTPEIMNGTASPDTLNAYYDRTVEPIATAFALEFKRKFLTTNARTRRHSIEFFRDPLKLIPSSEIGDVIDALRRNEVVTSNEIRPKIGYFPSKDPAANVMGNPNMPVDKQNSAGAPAAAAGEPDELDGELSGLEGTIDSMLQELGDG